MIPAVIFPDAQALLIPELRARLATAGSPVPVVSKVPKPRPESFVQVNRTGGSKPTPVTESVQITCDSWADTAPAAAELAMLTRAIITNLAGTQLDSTQIYRVEEFSGAAELPDPATGTPRYRQTFAIQLRGSSFN